MAPMPAIPSDVPVKPVLLSREQRGWLEQAVSRIDEERMRRSTAPSPASTARLVRRAASEWMVQQMLELGTDAFYQPLDERSGNAGVNSKALAAAHHCSCMRPSTPICVLTHTKTSPGLGRNCVLTCSPRLYRGQR